MQVYICISVLFGCYYEEDGRPVQKIFSTFQFFLVVTEIWLSSYCSAQTSMQHFSSFWLLLLEELAKDEELRELMDKDFSSFWLLRVIKRIDMSLCRVIAKSYFSSFWLLRLKICVYGDDAKIRILRISVLFGCYVGIITNP